MTSRELVYQTLDRKGPARVARQLWALPWAQFTYPEMMEKLNHDFVWDIGGIPAQYATIAAESGDPYAVGEYIDPWGCRFSNIHRGVIGEVKHPIVCDDNWQDAAQNVHIPEEWLSFDADAASCAARASDQFVLAGCCPRPFEQLQFMRGTAQLYMDLVDRPAGMCAFIEQMHDFYCRLLTKWAQTDVDALQFMDDWGSQQSLLISPTTWKQVFLPLYKDYIDIAHKHGKRIFMHSDGYTLAMLPHLIDAGLDAINCQIFCMGVDKLAQFKGRITFWGEIDRQHLIPEGTPAQIDHAVDSILDTLWADGGVIAQCEFGPGANPENVHRIFTRFAQRLS